MCNADWIVTVRVRLKDFVAHDDGDAADIVRALLDEECGFAGFCDWPDDYLILNIEPGDKLI